MLWPQADTHAGAGNHVNPGAYSSTNRNCDAPAVYPNHPAAHTCAYSSADSSAHAYTCAGGHLSHHGRGVCSKKQPSLQLCRTQK